MNFKFAFVPMEWYPVWPNLLTGIHVTTIYLYPAC